MKTNNKAELRATMRDLLAGLDPLYRTCASQEIGARAIQQVSQCKARAVALFMATALEPDTRSVISHCLQHHIKVYLPAFTATSGVMTFRQITALHSDVQPHPRYDILEPRPTNPELVDAQRLDLVFVPVVAVDTQKNRLGHGAGYYDRWFAEHRFSGQKIGLAFAEQLLTTPLAVDVWDVPLDQVITNRKPAD